jgi:hypothetical protein
VAARHEGRHLLVTRLDELRVAVGPVERPEEAVDAVTGVTEDAVDPPVSQASKDEVGNELGHGRSFRSLRGVVPGSRKPNTS